MTDHSTSSDGTFVTERQLREALREIVDPYLRPGEATEEQAAELLDFIRGRNGGSTEPLPTADEVRGILRE